MASPASPCQPTVLDGLQRRTVGSIRNNPKLSRIRQQFEKGVVESVVNSDCFKDLPKSSKELYPSRSAPPSLNFSYCGIKNGKEPTTVFEIAMQENESSFRPKASQNSDHLRRHSEGDAVTRYSNRKVRPGCASTNSFILRRERMFSGAPASPTSNLSASTRNRCINEENKQDNFPLDGNDGFCINSLSSNFSSCSSQNVRNANVQKNYSVINYANGVPYSSTLEDLGVSKHLDSAVSSSLSNLISKSNILTNFPVADSEHFKVPHNDNIYGKNSACASMVSVSSPVSKTPSTTKGVIKKDSVRNAIRIYEGMSGSETSQNSLKLESNHPKTLNKHEPFLGTTENCEKKPGIPRRSSRRNSIRRSKTYSKKDYFDNKERKIESCESEIIHRHVKEDSGVGLSDTEELSKDYSSQPIYQTLCGTKRSFDPYDRLNRIHDMVNRIHKGQSSTCAACKAIPSANFAFSPTAESSFLHVRCNEALPHHHPPCVCFLCQHSIFSCVQGAETSSEISLENLKISDAPDSLYYNMCCLNAPTPDIWRQSRRKPVCEQNGRLCVVNCDVERSTIELNEFYEKLSEWHSNPSNIFPRNEDFRTALRMKQVSGDSCDSDEGWVDISDSEEEKASSVSINQHQRGISNFGATFENAAYDAHDQGIVHSESHHGNISRSSSSEHLYETIADVDSQNNIQNGNDHTGNSHRKSSTPLPKSNSVDYDHDSGEWSTGSSSPLLNESLNCSGMCESTIVVSDPYPVPCNNLPSEPNLDENSTKKTFIKSVLSKKTVASKKRRMSNFFVPWLVSNQEYVSAASRSPKVVLKKQASRAIRMDANLPKAKRTFTKSKRSQSIPVNNCNTYVTKNQEYHITPEASENSNHQIDSVFLAESVNEENMNSSFGINIDRIPTISQRGSLASSTYLRPDQLHCIPSATNSRPCTSTDTSAVDVWMQKVTKRSNSGESDHSYILFQPIKEEDVPLYQFYERNIKERVALCRTPDSLSPVIWSAVVENNCNHECGQKIPALKSQLSVIEQLSPDAKESKILWCELPEVKDSGILGRISAQELKLQEAAFEFIQSQASYIRSLKLLYEHFILSPEFSDTQSSHCVLSKHEHDVLFSDIVRVKEVSESLMAELTNRWSEGILIPDICDILYKHTTLSSFSIYVKYCSNRVYQERTLKELKETRLCFLEVLRRLESNPACQGLSLESFLFLPMQHIARLPLLLDSIFRWLTEESPSYNICRMTLEVVQKIFIDCNEGAKKMERLEEMLILNKQLEFRDCKAIPLISTSRWLLKKGELTKLEFDKKTFGRTNRCVRNPLYIFLFNDLIVITKRKSEDSYIVVDYCLRDKIQVTAVDAKDLPQPLLIPSTCHYLIYLTLSSNHQGNTIDMIMNCTLLSERIRWIEAIHPASQNKTNDVWDYDCPQVQCVRTYIAQQPDELSLQESDVVTIYRKMNDGWYEGRRLRDGLQGWFPASYTMDIPCSRARASNLRQCYRLLMLSQKHMK